jgi:acyl transferase domain-containing protein/thioesterase domain-containing protein/acyl carrier protein
MSDDNNDSLDTDIAVVGMAGRFPGARNIHEYWANLRNGVESLQRFSDEELKAAGVPESLFSHPNYVKTGAVLPDMEMFDAPFFGFSPREASIMDPQHRHFLEVSWEALENAGHVPDKFNGSIGVFGGSGHNAYMPYNLMTNPKLMQSVGFFLVRHTGNDKDFLTTRVSYLLNLKGPSVNVQTACSTSLVAIHTGVQALLNGECDMALAGGVTIEMPHRRGYMYEEGEILSPDGHCHAFDEGSQGTVFGSAVGVVVLRRLRDALEDGDHIHAVIKGSAINNDGAMKVGYMAPSVDGQAAAISEALALANVPADSISYVEAHGTGTPVGDPIEVAALTQAHRQSTDKVGYCGIGSVKSNIGHTDTAAGVASFIKVAMAMQAKELPPSLHFKSPNPACSFETSPFYVNHTLKAWNPPAGVRRAGVSSLGVGGTNAHIILQEAPKRPASGPATRPYQLLMFSAKSTNSLDAYGKSLAEFFQQRPDTNLADAAYTLNVGRQAMKHRRVVVAKTPAEAAELLLANDPKVIGTTLNTEQTRSVAFMFAGGGAQYPNMGKGLYESEPVYRKAVDECLALLAKNSATDYKGLLFPAAGTEAEAAEKIQRPSLALPLLLTTQYAQAKLWMSWGLNPTAMIGHSMGEYTAAHLAGVFSLGEALTLVELRGKLFETLPEGGMLSVPLSEDELKPYMTPELSFAAINGPKLTVASGPVEAIDALQKRLEAAEIEASRVRISVAAHSSMLEPILKEFGEFFSRIRMNAPKLPFVSNLSGTWITPAEATDPQYWVRHLRNTVRFADGLQELLKDASRILLEVGPGRTMASLARQHPGRPAAQPVLNSMRHPDEQVHDQAYVLGQLGRLWAAGAEPDWDAVRGNEKRQRIQLPTYQFDHVRHWVEPGTSAAAATHEADGSLHKRSNLTEWFYQPVWQRATLDVPAAEEGAEAQRALVFVDDTGLGERLAARLRETGHEVYTVRAGKGYTRKGNHEFTINAAKAADHDKLIATLAVEGHAPQAIYHLWSVTGSKPLDGSAKTATELQTNGFFSLLYLAQAIGKEDLSDPIRLGVISDHLQRVAGETGLVPAKATVLGPCRVIPQEFKNIRCVSIDVDAMPAAARLQGAWLDRLIADVTTSSGDEAVAYRATERWVQGFGALPLKARDGKAPPALREGGVYLLTGGLGGAALALGEHLARTVKAKLVLVARGVLPPKEQWDAWLRDNDPESQTGKRIRHVKALEALGAEVLVVAADVTDLTQMRHAVKQARARFGAVNGVLHTAGVLNDGVIQLKEAGVASKVLAPKLQGTLVLEAAFNEVQKDAPLDFVILFSSISSFAGLAGQVDYAAANAFLDAYAQDRIARDGTYTVAVNWSQWAEVGMAAELAQQLGIAQGKGTPVGHPLVERCLKDGADERLYATRFSLKTHWLLDEHRVLGGEALIPGTGYLDLVRAAFTHHRQAKPVEIRNVTFLAPFAVRVDEEKDLHVRFKRAADGASWNFTVTGRSAKAADDAPWTENVRGQVGYVDVPVPTHESAADIAKRCTLRSQVFTGEEKQTHLHFGPRWSNIQRIDLGNGEALMQLALKPEFVGDLQQFELHPAVLDMATGGAQSLVPGFDDKKDFFVPAGYGQLRIFAPLTPKLTSHIRYRASEDGGDDLAIYDVTLCDEQGRVLVDIEEFTMIRVRDKALLARSGDEASAKAEAAGAHKPRATANNVLALGLRDGILSAEGAEIIERVLAWQPGPQVAVSPQDLHAFLAQLRAPTTPAAKDGEGDGAAARGADFKAPVTQTEILIAQMWGDMLGVDHVSATDNFFDLGGHSLLAVQVINKLKKRTGKTLPLTALLEAPTVEGLAALIEPKDEAAIAAAAGASSTGEGKPAAAPLTTNNTLIRIKQGSGTGKPAIFFVHDGNGETLLYRTLALQLDPGHTVYGLQPARRGDVFVHTRIVDMAAAHVEAIRSVQPHGPYFIAGLCAGGVIAFEMARQLQDAGETTQYVGIIDAADVACEERRYRLLRIRMERLQRALSGGDGPVVSTLLKKAGNFAKYQVEMRVEKFQNKRKVAAMREVVEQTDAPAAGPDISFLKMYEVAHRQHTPTGLFSGGDVVLYRATQGDGSTGDVPFQQIYVGETMGWAERVAHAAVRVLDIPGGHSSALQEPHVKTLSAAMQAHIDEALAKMAPAAEPTPATPAAERSPATVD